MPKQLLESDFLTVNLSDILKNQKSIDEFEVEPKNDTPSQEQKKELKQVSDWGAELKKRLEANSKLDTTQQKKVYEVESEFFKDYFNNGDASWNKNCALLLLSFGEPLKKAIKVLGFDKNINPILGFITDDNVIKNLIQTKLLNVNTFKAIYNAVAKKLVADSEFFSSNDYNIIYCQDLYRKSVSEIEQYLELQTNILKPSASSYSLADQEKNKKIFFQIKSIKELDIEKRKAEIAKLPANAQLPSAEMSDTTLNRLDLVKLLLGYDINTADTSDLTKAKSNSSTNTLAKSIAAEPAQTFAVIQYLSMTSGLPEAKQALQNEVFRNLPVDKLVTATTKVAPIMKQTHLPEAEVKAFIKLLLGRLTNKY